jgi:DNA-binding SARP family transcriptional activator
VLVDGRPVDLTDLKPKARELLRFLVLYAGRPLHRERLIEQFWPDGDPASGLRGLQVAMSAIRRGLADAGAGALAPLRQGDAYVLPALGPDRSDLVAFHGALVAAGRDGAAGRPDDAARHLDDALQRYRGDLLPEDGPAEWVVGPREEVRGAAADAALALARLGAEQADHGAAAQACERGLRIDPYRDELWRLVIDAYDRAGDTASAGRARRAYADVLHDLGTEPVRFP